MPGKKQKSKKAKANKRLSPLSADTSNVLWRKLEITTGKN